MCVPAACLMANFSLSLFQFIIHCVCLPAAEGDEIAGSRRVWARVVGGYFGIMDSSLGQRV